MTLLVSSYSDSFAPGTLLVHSEDSANASSALQPLETRMPDHDPDSNLMFWPASVKGAIEERASRQRKKRFAAESALTDNINSRPSFRTDRYSFGTFQSMQRPRSLAVGHTGEIT
jgi:hypothetical protein